MNTQFVIIALIITTIYWRSKLCLENTWIFSEEGPQGQNKWYFE